MLDDDQPESEKQRMDPDHCNVLVRTKNLCTAVTHLGNLVSPLNI